MKFKEGRIRVVLFVGKNLNVTSSVWAYLINRKETVVKVLKEDDEITVDTISEFSPDVMITCYWPFLLPKEIIDIPAYGTINFHPSLLPYNRGWYPAMWPFIDGSKAGVTLHLIDEGADTGDILAQQEIGIEETDTAGDVYTKSERAMVSLFKDTWNKLYTTGIEPIPQDHSKATYHTKKEGNAFNEILLDDNIGRFISLLKSRTFWENSYAYYLKGGKRYSVKIEIKEVKE